MTDDIDAIREGIAVVEAQQREEIFAASDDPRERMARAEAAERRIEEKERLEQRLSEALRSHLGTIAIQVAKERGLDDDEAERYERSVGKAAWEPFLLPGANYAKADVNKAMDSAIEEQVKLLQRIRQAKGGPV